MYDNGHLCTNLRQATEAKVSAAWVKKSSTATKNTRNFGPPKKMSSALHSTERLHNKILRELLLIASVFLSLYFRVINTLFAE